MLSIGGHVDSAFKEMAKYPRFSNNSDCQEILDRITESETRLRNGESPIPVPIWLPLRAFETEYGLSNKKVMFKCLPERDPVTPFSPFVPKINAPEWWSIYNGLKHAFSENVEKANLKNTRDALAAAFLLNVIHYSAILRLYDHSLLLFPIPASKIRKIDGTMSIPRHKLENYLNKKLKFDGEIETDLFLYCYNQ